MPAAPISYTVTFWIDVQVKGAATSRRYSLTASLPFVPSEKAVLHFPAPKPILLPLDPPSSDDARDDEPEPFFLDLVVVQVADHPDDRHSFSVLFESLENNDASFIAADILTLEAHGFRLTTPPAALE
jgi:hypothetical protein